MNPRPLSDAEIARLSEKAARLADEMRKQNPTQSAWDSLRWLEESVRQGQIERNRVGAIHRVLVSFGIE